MSSDKGHYYAADGTPCHSYLNAKGEEKKTDLRYARKNNLFPSFSTIVKATLANDAIAVYAKNQILKAAWDSFGEETRYGFDVWSKKVLEKADEDRDDAADLGTAIHASIENWSQGKPYNKEHEVYINCVREFREQYKIEPIAHERTFANFEHGYGGTIDEVGEMGDKVYVGDFKSRKTRRGEKCSPYETHPMQIAAYGEAWWDLTRSNDVIGWNLYISTTEPGRWEAVFYDNETLKHEFKKFNHILQYWQLKRGYYPHLTYGANRN